MFKLQHGTPLPRTIRPNARGRRKYPLEEMQVGSWFFVPDRKQPGTYFYNEAKRLGITLKVRATYAQQVKDEWQLCDEADDGAKLGVGVWRTE